MCLFLFGLGCLVGGMIVGSYYWIVEPFHYREQVRKTGSSYFGE